MSSVVWSSRPAFGDGREKNDNFQLVILSILVYTNTKTNTSLGSQLQGHQAVLVQFWFALVNDDVICATVVIKIRIGQCPVNKKESVHEKSPQYPHNPMIIFDSFLCPLVAILQVLYYNISLFSGCLIDCRPTHLQCSKLYLWNWEPNLYRIEIKVWTIDGTMKQICFLYILNSISWNYIVPGIFCCNVIKESSQNARLTVPSGSS